MQLSLGVNLANVVLIAHLSRFSPGTRAVALPPTSQDQTLVLPTTIQNNTSLLTFEADLLGANVAAELNRLSRQPDTRVSRAQLVRVQLSQPGRDPWLRSSKVEDFQKINIALRAAPGPPASQR